MHRYSRTCLRHIYRFALDKLITEAFVDNARAFYKHMLIQSNRIRKKKKKKTITMCILTTKFAALYITLYYRGILLLVNESGSKFIIISITWLRGLYACYFLERRSYKGKWFHLSLGVGYLSSSFLYFISFSFYDANLSTIIIGLNLTTILPIFKTTYVIKVFKGSKYGCRFVSEFCTVAFLRLFANMSYLY